MTGLGRGKQRRQVEIGVGAGNEVHAVIVDKVIFHALCHAADYTYHKAFPLRFAVASHCAQRLQTRYYLLLGIVAD